MYAASLQDERPCSCPPRLRARRDGRPLALTADRQLGPPRVRLRLRHSTRPSERAPIRHS
jgi:hypothetical protein